MENALARLARVAEGNHNNLRSSGQSSLPASGGKPATSLFGSFNTAQPQQNVSTTQAQTSSLFGNTSQPAQTGGLFGNTTSQPTQTSSLFGNTTSQPTQTSSLFGNTASQSQGGGIFGSSQNQAGNNQQQGSSVFGSNANNQSGVGLFGSQQNNLQTTGGLFGGTTSQQSQPQPQPQQHSLFGSVGQNQIQQPQSDVFGAASSQNKSSSLLFVTSQKYVGP